jgi:hypothetical protein
MYRRWSITSYNPRPTARYQETLGWLTDWFADLQGEVG